MQTEEEARLRAEEGIRALESLDEMGDEEEQRETFEMLARSLAPEELSEADRGLSAEGSHSA